MGIPVNTGPSRAKVLGWIAMGAVVAFALGVPARTRVAGDVQAIPGPKADPAPARPVPRLGWRRPAVPADHARTGYRLAHPVTGTNPATVDLRPVDGPIENQLQLGSCTTFAIAGAIRIRDRQLGDDFPISHLFLYWTEREREGTTGYDAGAAIADGVKVVVTLGYPRESTWAYDIRQYRTRPPASAYADAATHVLAPRPASIDNASLDEMRSALAAGHPIVFGFLVEPALFDVGPDGIYHPTGEEPVGGHAVCAVGYDDARRVLIVRNSWGTDWGDHGYFYLPYSVYTDGRITSDAWAFPALKPPDPPAPPAPDPGPPPPTPPPTPAPAPAGTTTITVTPGLGPGDSATVTRGPAPAPEPKPDPATIARVEVQYRGPDGRWLQWSEADECYYTHSDADALRRYVDSRDRRASAR
jgi:hypothetical protein